MLNQCNKLQTLTLTEAVELGRKTKAPFSQTFEYPGKPDLWFAVEKLFPGRVEIYQLQAGHWALLVKDITKEK